LPPARFDGSVATELADRSWQTVERVARYYAEPRRLGFVPPFARSVRRTALSGGVYALRACLTLNQPSPPDSSSQATHWWTELTGRLAERAAPTTSGAYEKLVPAARSPEEPRVAAGEEVDTIAQ
jgi:hypothetical protein